MKYIAHKTEDGREQLLVEHLRGTAELCSSFAVDELKSIAYYCGIMHDIGKYSYAFQSRIRGKDIRVGHALSGAQTIAKKTEGNIGMRAWGRMLEYCIAGHHSGLPDGGSKTDNIDMPTLHAILARQAEDYSAYESEINAELPDSGLNHMMIGCKTNEELYERYAFLTRYLYSCLTDADFIDTESFFETDTDRKIDGDFKKAYEKVCDKLSRFVAETELQKARGKIQKQVYQSMESDGDLFTINMPTGSGKTLCSIRAALKMAMEQKKKRIIYVIPYVSIIEQTAQVFEELFGDVLPVIQHQSNYDPDEGSADENILASEKIKKACENWDAPLIVTTNIQFFESLYHYKSSRLRKLHNLKDSVIIFDEVHMLPVEYIQPCIRAIGHITKFLGAKAILMSATMPDYSQFIREYAGDAKVIDTILDKSQFRVFNKCNYRYIHDISYEDLCERASAYKSALIIVNSRKAARDLYTMLEGNKYHLSTYMTPCDRSDMIGRIKDDLKECRQIVVVSTSLIEAGVDLDFEVVFRENAGIDHIIQAGGRCNREGKRETADVFVFEIEGGGENIGANITKSLFQEYSDISADECIKEYYHRLFQHDKEKIDKNTITQLMGNTKSFDSIPFREYAQNFQFIENDVIGVVVPTEENEGIIHQLKNGMLSVKRKLQKYSASVKIHELKTMNDLGIIEMLDCGVCVLRNPDYYDDEIGLVFEQGKDYFI